MTEIDKILDKWINDRQKELVQQYDSLGLRASGKFEKGLVNETENKKTRLIDTYGHSWYMVNGRAPNKNQSPEKLKAWVGWAGSTFLKQWVDDKGLSVSPFAVAWKIAKSGVLVPNKNNSGKLMDIFTQNKFDNLGVEILNYEVKNIKSEIVKTWQQV